MQTTTTPKTLESLEKELSSEKPKWGDWMKEIEVDVVKQKWKKEYEGNPEKTLPDLHMKIYTKAKPDESVVQAWQEVTIPDMDIDKFVKFSSDMALKKEQDENVLESKSIKQLNKFQDVGYFQVKTPFIMSNRDFLFLRTSMNNKDHPELVEKHKLPKSDDKYYLYRVEPIELEEVPKGDKFVRAEMFQTAYFISPKPNQVKYTTVQQFDLKGSIPKFLMNGMAGRGAKDAIKKIYDQYQDLVKKGKL